jgi:hypothetical protein
MLKSYDTVKEKIAPLLDLIAAAGGLIRVSSSSIKDLKQNRQRFVFQIASL